MTNGNILFVVVLFWWIFLSQFNLSKTSRSNRSDTLFVLEQDAEKGSPGKNLFWHWEDEFNLNDRKKVEEWIYKVKDANEQTLGAYPFEVHIHIYIRENSTEPVPWANTWRYPEQSVHFYIDPDYSLQSFLDDWTAPHEMSHLSIPYLGEKNAWFAEGYASFMQYQVMMKMGIYTQEQVDQSYYNKIKNVESYFQSDEDFVTVVRQLRKQKKYSQMYWGSSTYFITLNEILQEQHNITLMDVVKEYQSCCRLKDRSLNAVIESWDAIIGAEKASELLDEYNTQAARDVILH